VKKLPVILQYICENPRREAKRASIEKFMKRCREVISNKDHLKTVEKALYSTMKGKMVTIETDDKGGVRLINCGKMNGILDKSRVLTRWASDCYELMIDVDSKYFEKMGKLSTKEVLQKYQLFERQLKGIFKEYSERGLSIVGLRLSLDKSGNPQLKLYDIQEPESADEIAYQRKLLKDRKPFDTKFLL